MDMKIINEKEFILHMIKDDITNIRLVTGLISLGLDASHYHLYLSQTIFSLMGFIENQEQDEELFEEYCELSKKALEIDIFEYPEKFNEFVLEVYNKLNSAREARNSST